MKRFISMDPLGYVDSMNMYESFGCDPVNNVDPMGLEIYLVRQRMAMGGVGRRGGVVDRLSTNFGFHIRLVAVERNNDGGVKNVRDISFQGVSELWIKDFTESDLDVDKLDEYLEGGYITVAKVDMGQKFASVSDKIKYENKKYNEIKRLSDKISATPAKYDVYYYNCGTEALALLNQISLIAPFVPNKGTFAGLFIAKGHPIPYDRKYIELQQEIDNTVRGVTRGRDSGESLTALFNKRNHHIGILKSQYAQSLGYNDFDSMPNFKAQSNLLTSRNKNVEDLIRTRTSLLKDELFREQLDQALAIIKQLQKAPIKW